MCFCYVIIIINIRINILARIDILIFEIHFVID